MIADSKPPIAEPASASIDAERVAPPECRSAAEIHAANEAADRESRLAEGNRCGPPVDSPSQFSLRDLFMLTTIIGIELAGLRWFGSRGLAAIVGIAAVAWLFIIAVYQLKSPFAKLVCWALMVGYLLALATALVPSSPLAG